MLVSWNTTNQCNMFCDHCYRDAGARLGDELNTGEGKRLIEQIREAGFRIMIFSGGEPLMRPDLFELGDYARSQGLRPVLGTNATLINPRVARELKAAGFQAAGVSLDSLDSQKYDAFRHLEKAFERTVEGIHNLKEAGLAVQIHTTVMDWNVEELEALTDYAIEIGAMGHHVFFMVPTGRAVHIEQEALRVAQYEKTINLLMKKQQEVAIEIKPTCAPQFMRIAAVKGVSHRFTRGCLAGISYCIISPVGQVQPCAYLDIKLGNVREHSFAKIWQDNPVFQQLREAEYKGKCGICDFKDRCGGCRARAYYYSGGDMMAEDNWCSYQPGRRGKDEQ